MKILKDLMFVLVLGVLICFVAETRFIIVGDRQNFVEQEHEGDLTNWQELHENSGIKQINTQKQVQFDQSLSNDQNILDNKNKKPHQFQHHNQDQHQHQHQNQYQHQLKPILNYNIQDSSKKTNDRLLTVVQVQPLSSTSISTANSTFKIKSAIQTASTSSNNTGNSLSQKNNNNNGNNISNNNNNNKSEQIVSTFLDNNISGSTTITSVTIVQKSVALPAYTTFLIPSWADLNINAISSSSNIQNPYSTATTNILTMTTTSTQDQTPTPAQSLTSTLTIQKQFPGIKLYTNIPTILVQGQFLLLKGQTVIKNANTNANNNNSINSNSTNTKFNFIFVHSLTGARYNFQSQLKQKNQFKVQVQVPPVGNYQISMFLGLSGNVSTQAIQVISNKNVINSSQKSLNSSILTPVWNFNFSLQIITNNFYIKFFSNSNSNSSNNSNNGNLRYQPSSESNSQSSLFFLPAFRLEFTQTYRTAEKVVLYLSNFDQSTDLFLIPYAKFVNFANGFTMLNVSMGITTAYSMSGLVKFYDFYQYETFEAIQHQFLQIKDNLLAFQQTPPCYLSTGQDMQIKGQAKSPLKNSMVVLQPTKTFKQYPLDNLLQSNQTLIINSLVNLTFLISSEGTYIVQINHIDGYAVLNQPVYVGVNKYPLLPDFSDLDVSLAVSNSLISYDLEKQKTNLLNLINQKRRQFNQSALQMDDQLSQLAQNHSNDMVQRNYVSHYTPQGMGPSQRAAQFGIYSQISQNVGVNRNITNAHYRFCRSNIHLRNLVNPNWKRIGLGLKLGPNNNYYITHEFSVRDLEKYPLTSLELDSMKGEILGFFVGVSSYLKSQNIGLSNNLKTYQNTLMSTPNSNLGDYLKSHKIYSRWAYTNLSISYVDNFMDIIRQQVGILPTSSAYNQIGMSIQYKNGLLAMYFAFVFV